MRGDVARVLRRRRLRVERGRRRLLGDDRLAALLLRDGGRADDGGGGAGTGYGRVESATCDPFPLPVSLRAAVRGALPRG
jgi:hypothetical protein